MIALVSLGVYFCVLLSGSVFCAVWFGKRPENTLPLTTMLLILLLFFFGLCSRLALGVTVALAIVCGLYLAACFRLIQTRKWKAFVKDFFTIGLLVFVGSFCVLTVLSYGRVASSWDEFSHWMDVVKAMVTVDDFSTNPDSLSTFVSYPPGMSLLQYFHQKIIGICNKAPIFVEWRAYLSYQLFFVAILMPLFRNCSLRKPLRLILLGVIAFFTPMIFFSNLYTGVYIDPILGLLFGGGAAMVFLKTEEDWTYHLHICLVCCMLVLMKDVGLLFAVFLALIYGADRLSNATDFKDMRNLSRILTPVVGIFALSMTLKLLWSWEVTSSGYGFSFSGKVDIVNLIQVLLGHDTSYRRETLENYVDALAAQSVSFGSPDIGTVSISYGILVLLFAIASIAIWKLYQKQDRATSSKCWTLCLIFVLCVVYFAGMCVMYMYKFSEYESVRLASLARYLNIVCLAYCFFLLIIFVDAIAFDTNRTHSREICFLLVLILCLPLKSICNLVNGTEKASAHDIRSVYEPLSSVIRNTCDGDDIIYVISQEDNGFDFWVIRFNARPNQVVTAFSWSIGEPFYDGDIWTRSITAEDWRQELISSYDYVALYKLNDYFYETYSILFEQPDTIGENQLYRVNKETGLLENCST